MPLARGGLSFARRGFVETFTEEDDIRLGLVIASTIVERGKRVEQGRILDLWRLLAELTERGVGRLVIENRWWNHWASASHIDGAVLDHRP